MTKLTTDERRVTSIVRKELFARRGVPIRRGTTGCLFVTFAAVDPGAGGESPFNLEKQLEKIKLLAAKSPGEGFTFCRQTYTQQREDKTQVCKVTE